MRGRGRGKFLLFIGRFQEYIIRSVFPTLHQVRRIGLLFDLLNHNGNRILPVFKRTIERYKQDRNVFLLLITNKCEFRCCDSIIKRNGPLK